MFPQARALTLALLAVLLLSPLAAADHAYSHRFLLFGRVVDANGDAVPGLTVNLQPHDFAAMQGACNDQPFTDTDAFGPTKTIPVTNDHGEFMFCYHAHTMSKYLTESGTLSVAGTNTTVNVTFDPYFRENYVPIKLDRVMPHANKTALADSYTVYGRVFRPGDTVLEGNFVYGLTVVQSPVNITIALPDGTTLHANTTTNGYGDYSVRVPTASRLEGGTVTMKMASGEWSAPVDPTTGVTVFEATGAPLPSDETKHTVSATAIFIGAGVVVAAGAAGGVGYVTYRRSNSGRASSGATRAMRRRQQR